MISFKKKDCKLSMLKDLLHEISSHTEGSPPWRKACGKLLWELGSGEYKTIFDPDLLSQCLQVAEKFDREDIVSSLRGHLGEVERLFDKLQTLTEPPDVMEAVLSSRLIASDVKSAEEFLQAFWATHEVSSKDEEEIANLLQRRLAGEGVKGLFLSGGVGVVRKVYLHTSYNGSGRITCGNRAGENMERAGRNAVAAALRYLEEEGIGRDIRCDVHWQVEGVAEEYEGSSVGLAVAVGVIGSYLKHVGIAREDTSQYAFTGEVEVDGRITKVGGIAAKSRAADADEGIGCMVYPSGCGDEIPKGLSRCQFLPCGHLREAVEAVWGEIPKRERIALNARTLLIVIGAIIGTVAIVAFLWWLEAFSWAGVGLEGALFRVRSVVDVNQEGAGVDLPITIVSIDDRSVKELGEYGLGWRGHHSRLVNVLASEGARSIGFDICFEGDSEWDGELASSLRRVTAAGVAVVLGIGCSVDDGGPILPPEEIGRAASGLGSIYLGQVRGVVRKAQVAIPQVPVSRNQSSGIGSHQPIQALQVPAIPSFDLQLLAGGRVEDARLSLREGKLYSSSTPPIPVDREGYVHIDFGRGEFTRISYADALSGRSAPNFFRRKMVLIGSELKVHGKEIDHYFTPGGRMYGVEIHAHAIGTLLRGRYIRSPEGAPLRALWVGLWVSSVAVLSLRFIRRRLLILGLEAIAVAFTYFYLFLYFDLLIDMVYPLVGMGLAFWWTGRMINSQRIK